jgi:hypothetical protein
MSRNHFQEKRLKFCHSSQSISFLRELTEYLQDIPKH